MGNTIIGSINITVNVDGVDFNVSTDINGYWALLDCNLSIGVLNVFVSWMGDSNYLGFVNNKSINVTPISDPISPNLNNPNTPSTPSTPNNPNNPGDIGGDNATNNKASNNGTNNNNNDLNNP